MLYTLDFLVKIPSLGWEKSIENFFLLILKYHNAMNYFMYPCKSVLSSYIKYNILTYTLKKMLEKDMQPNDFFHRP